jgi:hypothetical protein
MPTAAMRSYPKDGPSLPAGPVDVTAATKPEVGARALLSGVGRALAALRRRRFLLRRITSFLL